MKELVDLVRTIDNLQREVLHSEIMPYVLTAMIEKMSKKPLKKIDWLTAEFPKWTEEDIDKAIANEN